MRLICDYRAPIGSGSLWRRRFIAVICLGLGAYLFAYGIAYQRRVPAANLAFWYYGNYDEVLYPLRTESLQRLGLADSGEWVPQACLNKIKASQSELALLRDEISEVL